MTTKQNRMLWSVEQRQKTGLPSELRVPQVNTESLIEALAKKTEEQKTSPYKARFDDSCLAQIYN